MTFGYSKPRNFKSKLDEAIWDAEQKLSTINVASCG